MGFLIKGIKSILRSLRQPAGIRHLLPRNLKELKRAQENYTNILKLRAISLNLVKARDYRRGDSHKFQSGKLRVWGSLGS